MPYKSPIGRYKSLHVKQMKQRQIDRAPSPRQCGQGIINGDERYCPACGKAWPKNEDHP